MGQDSLLPILGTERKRRGQATVPLGRAEKQKRQLIRAAVFVAAKQFDHPIMERPKFARLAADRPALRDIRPTYLCSTCDTSRTAPVSAEVVIAA